RPKAVPKSAGYAGGHPVRHPGTRSARHRSAGNGAEAGRPAAPPGGLSAEARRPLREPRGYEPRKRTAAGAVCPGLPRAGTGSGGRAPGARSGPGGRRGRADPVRGAGPRPVRAPAGAGAAAPPGRAAADRRAGWIRWDPPPCAPVGPLVGERRRMHDDPLGSGAHPSGARPRVLLVDNHDSYTWNLHQLIWQVAGVEPVTVRNDEVDPAEVLAAGHTHLVISPGPGTPL